ncbi:MAG: dihydroorotase [Thiohalophilus sp.]|uniref:dihydroorotase n=1 Tax=Thiohalophilus sp. TaxID=3028392 RepID=UPI00287071B7|nr:dihydroorotase [Thiohalophilus sp.]MDR9437583.1 dihydroorotase [Thiohalophilus sp.]
MDQLTLTRPDDWHLHVRDGAVLPDVLGDTARRFARAIIMPNLKPPVTTVDQALAYRQRILDALPAGTPFNPLMTLYLTDDTTAEEIHKAAGHPDVHAVKLYPAGATTNSAAGVTAIEKTWDAIEAMAQTGLPLLIHGEATEPDIDIFDREAVYIDRTLRPLLERFPTLKVVLEHITTRQAAEFVHAGPDNLGATITPHHLLMNRNAMFRGGMNPHHFCLPILKREQHRQALLKAAISDTGRFFLGTDSAPHPRHAKESGCGCAGIYSAHAALELYAEAFDEAGALDKLEGFASHYGADFYGLPRNTDRVTLIREDWTVADSMKFGEEELIPLRAGQTVHWRIKD